MSSRKPIFFLILFITTFYSNAGIIEWATSHYKTVAVTTTTASAFIARAIWVKSIQKQLLNGGLGQNKQLGVGVATNKGSRITMEDAHCAHLKDKASFIGVFDGHGGSNVARWLAKNLNAEVLKVYTPGFWALFFKGKSVCNYDIPTLTDQQITQTFLNVDKKLNTSAGSTAVCAVIDKDNKTLKIANVGDSRAVLASKENYEQLSLDHKCNREYARLTALGATISRGYVYTQTRSWWPPFKLKSQGIAVSRAFGDRHFKKPNVGVIAEPEIYTHTIKEDDQFVILASDGIWDDMDSDIAITFVKEQFTKGNDATAAAQALIDEASKKSIYRIWGSHHYDSSKPENMRKMAHDNQTVVILTLNNFGKKLP